MIVRKQDPKEVVSEVRALLGDREGIQIRVVGDRVYLDGETITTDDYERVQQITQLFPSVKSFVRPSGNAKKLAAEALNRAFQKNGLKGVQAGVVGATIFLEGWVESQDDLKKLDLVTRAVGEKVENLVTVGVKKMVLVEVDFVEVSYGTNKLVGVKPPLQLDLRVDKTWRFTNGSLFSVYLDIYNAYNQGNVEGVSYNYNYTLSTFATGIPFLPSIGIRAEL